MADMDKDTITEVVGAAVKKALDEHHLCRYGILPDEVLHMTGMVKDLGGGNFARGVEVLRENHKFTLRFSAGINRIGEYAAKTFVTILVGVVLGLLWVGLKAKLL